MVFFSSHRDQFLGQGLAINTGGQRRPGSLPGPRLGPNSRGGLYKMVTLLKEPDDEYYHEYFGN